jgi:hypothetical protein
MQISRIPSHLRRCRTRRTGDELPATQAIITASISSEHGARISTTSGVVNFVTSGHAPHVSGSVPVTPSI